MRSECRLDEQVWTKLPHVIGEPRRDFPFEMFGAQQSVWERVFFDEMFETPFSDLVRRLDRGVSPAVAYGSIADAFNARLLTLEGEKISFNEALEVEAKGVTSGLKGRGVGTHRSAACNSSWEGCRRLAAPSRVRNQISVKREYLNDTIELSSLSFCLFDCRIGFFDQGRIMLCHLIHFSSMVLTAVVTSEIAEAC